MAKQTFTVGQVLTAAQMTDLQQTAMGGGSATAKTVSYTLVAADAGTTVIMNSASSTTITVNTALFAAGDTVLIVNQGAGVCTVTAGTATVSTAGSLALAQYETGLLYFLSTSAAIFSDYTQSSSTAGYTQISSTNIAGSGTSISSIPGTYNKLVLVVQDWYPSTDAENLRLRFNSDATAGAYGQAGVSNGVAFSNAQSYLWGSYQGAKNGDNNNLLVWEMENYANTNTHKVATYANYYLSGVTQMIDEGAMRWKNTSAITSIDFAATSGNIGQGTAILWGVK